MREILFRGKRKDNGEWIKGCYCEGNSWGTEVHYIVTTSSVNPFLCAIDVIPETVGQYTGLTDKNGKRIFEGDIVKAYDDTYDNGFAKVKGKVFFNCGSFDIDVKDVGYIPLYSYGTENIEVIENIHGGINDSKNSDQINNIL